MVIQIVEIKSDRLVEYATIPSQFLVRSVLQPELIQGGLGGVLFREVALDEPYIKDYDSNDELPTDWPKKFDISNWGFFLAMYEGRPVGGAAVAFSTPGVFMLEDRPNLSVLWDLRVHLEARGAGIMLFRHAAAWSRTRGCHQMKIETQNVNVPACRFYEQMGARLGEIRRFGYAGIPSVSHEIMLCWYLEL